MMEAHAKMALQRRMTTPDTIQLRNFRNDVARPVHIPLAQLVFLRIQILLFTGYSLRLAQLKAVVHAPGTRQRARQHGTDQKPCAARGLQKPWVNVRCIDEKIGAEEI